MATLAPAFLIGSCSFLTRTTIKSGQSSNLGQIGLRAAELAVLERIENFPHTYNGRNVVATPSNSFFIGSSSFFQVTRTTIKSGESLNLGT